MEVCSQCLEVKPVNKFINKKNGTKTEMCLRCRNIANESRKRKKLSKTYSDLKNDMGSCEICNREAQYMEFDHVDEETKNCRVMDCKTVDKMINERNKCRVVCIKCHRKLTHSKRSRKVTSNDKRKQGKYNRILRNIKYVNDVKIKIGGCQNSECDDDFDPDNLSFYEFDHIDYGTKKDAISNMAGSTYSVATIQKEIDKCRMLCGYCHRKRTEIQWKDRRSLLVAMERPIEKKVKRKIRKFTMDDVKEIRKLYKEYSTGQLSVMFGVTTSTISNIVANISYIDDDYIVPIEKHTMRSVAQYIGDNMVVVYDSVNEAIEYTGIKRGQIWAACTGRQKTAGGFVWKYSS